WHLLMGRIMRHGGVYETRVDSFETYEKAPCALEKGQRVAFLDGDRVLMATKVGEEITFAVRECKGGT
ncbi:MAG: hypothetical protein CTR55_20435, partial [Pseudomonas sp.]